MTKKHVELADAASFVETRFGGDAGTVELLGEGEWSRCFAYTHDGRELAIRFGGQVDDFEKDRFAARWRSSRLPIPEVLEVGEALGRYYAISSRARGQPLESLTTGRWHLVLADLLRMLDEMGSIDLSGSTGFGMWDGDGEAHETSWAAYLLACGTDDPSHRTHGWLAALATQPDEKVLFDRGFATLEALAGDCPEVRGVVHADLLNRNVLVTGDHISGIFDWGCGLYGDPLYDIATLVFWSPWFPELAAIDIVGEVRRHHARQGDALDGFDLRLRCSLLHIGLVHQGYTALLGRLDDLSRITGQVAALSH